MPNKQAKFRKQERKKLNKHLEITGRTANQVKKIANRNNKRSQYEGEVQMLDEFFQSNQCTMWYRYCHNGIYFS